MKEGLPDDPETWEWPGDALVSRQQSDGGWWWVMSFSWDDITAGGMLVMADLKSLNGVAWEVWEVAQEFGRKVS